MAEAVAAATSYIVSAFAASAAGTATLAQVATVVAVQATASMALNAAVGALTKPEVGQGGSPLEWRADPNAGLPYLMGKGRAVAGPIVYRKAFGPNNMYQGIVGIISAAGPILGMGTTYVEKAAQSLDATGEAIGTYQDKFWIKTQNGEQPEPAALTTPTGLRDSATLTGWTADHKLSGKAAYLMVLGHDAKGKVYPQGEPLFYQVPDGGIRAYDPRNDDEQPGGEGDERANDPSTWGHPTNGALLALQWARGLKEGSNTDFSASTLVGGMGMADDEIHWESFVEAANVADALGLECSAWPTSRDDKHQVLAALLQTAGAAPATINGKQGCTIRASSKTSLLTLDLGDIVGPMEMSRSPSRLERINTVLPRVALESHDWEETTLEPVTRAEYLAEDGGHRRSREISYPFVTDKDQAALLARYDIADAREGFIGAIPVKPHLRELEPGDAFTMPTDDGLGPLSGQKLLVMTREFDPENNVVLLGVRGETDEKHTWAGGATGTVTDPVTYDPPGLTFPAPDAGDWTLSVGTGELPGLVLTGEVTNPLADMVRVEWRPDGGTDWFHFGNYSAEVKRVEITLPGAATAYEVAVAYRSEQTGIWGARLVLGPATTGGVATTDVDWDEVDPPGPEVLNDWPVLQAPAGSEAGPLATSPLSEAKVQGRFLGFYADEAAAVSAGLQDGDLFVDESAYPPVLKGQVGGLIGEISETAAPLGTDSDVDVTSASMTTVMTFDLPVAVSASSFFVISFGLDLDFGVTVGSSSTTPPSGDWELWEQQPGGGSTGERKVAEGTWVAEIVGEGVSANVTGFDIDGAGDSWSDISRQWKFKFGGAERFELRMRHSGQSLSNAIGYIRVAVLRT